MGYYLIQVDFLRLSNEAKVDIVLCTNHIDCDAELDFVLDFNFGDTRASFARNHDSLDNHFATSFDGGCTSYGFLRHGH